MKRKIRSRILLICLAVLLWWLVKRQNQESEGQPAAAEIIIDKAAGEPAPSQPQRKRAAPKKKQPADDLTRLRGIGPKIDQVLKEAGITTFARLADTPADELQAIIRKANIPIGQPDSWIEQARQQGEA